MKINKESWHYEMACFGSDHIKYGWNTDLCEYMRAVLKGVLATICLFLIALLASWCVVDFFLWLTVSLLNSWFEAPLGATVAMLVMFLGLIALLIAGLIFGTKRLVSERTPNIVREAYKGWKGKYCPTIDLRA